MPKVKFRGAELRSLTANMEEGGIIYRLHFVSILSNPVAATMLWDILDEKGFLREGLENPKLAGILRTDKLQMEPNGLSGEDKEKHTLEFEIIEVSGFQAITKKNDDSREVYLKFCARSSSPFAPLEKWWKKWGNSPCLLTVEGIRQAELTEEDTEAEAEAEAAAAEPEAEAKPKRKRKGKQGEIFDAGGPEPVLATAE